MKNLVISGLFVALVATLGFAATTQPTYAAPHGNAWGYWSFPGNSLYGRSHNMHRHQYRWGGHYYEDWDEYVDAIQEWLERLYEWRDEHRDRWDDDDAEVEVVTLSAQDVDEDSAVLRGEVDLNDSDYAYVWFEYGESKYDLDEETTHEKVDDSDDEEFEEKIDDLDEGERYYYRAIAKDEDGEKDYGVIRYFTTDGDGNDDEPDARTSSAINIDYDEAELRGTVDMNDFNNGIVFFVYGEDEDAVEDVEDDYSRYADIDEDGDDLQKFRVDADLDGTKTYTPMVTGLDKDTRYYFAIGVEYEDEDDDDTIILGNVYEFRTDDEQGDDEPDATTYSALDIDENSAELRGSVDMNDYNNGKVFFVYGEDEDLIEDVPDEYDEYDDIDEEGEDLQKVLVDSDLDGDDTFERTVTGLDENTTIYYAIGVEYDDDDTDETIILGTVREFETD